MSGTRFFHSTMLILTGTVTGSVLALSSSKSNENRLRPSRLWKVYDMELQDKFYNKVAKELGFDEKVDLKVIPKKSK